MITGTSQYVFHAATATTGTTDITGGPITINITNGSGSVVCTVNVGNQTGIGPVKYANKAGGKVLVTSEATNVKTTTSGGLLNCGTTNGEHTSGTYTGSSEVSGVDTTGAAAELRVE